MKIDLSPQLLKFPKILPNDLESFLVFYPNKFPPIIPYYEEVAKKIAGDPEAFRKYGYWAHDELFAGFEKIQQDYEKGDQNDLDFLVEIDQRFNKLICYRFWIVNYLFPDGPVHDFFVDALKNLIRKFTEVSDEVEEFEGKVARIQRDLLQSDYADLYLQQALESVEILELLGKNAKTKNILSRAITLVDRHDNEDIVKINSLWDGLLKLIESGSTPALALIKKKMLIPLEQAVMRKNKSPIYNMLTHAVEFRRENEDLKARHRSMKGHLESIFENARANLTKAEFELFEVAFEQSRNFSMFKDIMGLIDAPLLPLWFGLHDQVRKILSRTVKVDPAPTGHAGMFYRFAWFLPAHLKDKVMTPDSTPFDLKNL